ncbi:hypothetical protein [Cylindrospermum sp. FACHB-282]|uniref:hypothetical protein n=1 Tax=Cylindrospermum sp. FACHB-282 TaxID=2692794 RepID=UPI001682964B|nr:hypothetical protein [Cylindrospermum sp. FACHB-282]MBD2388110.1 hypothetical protein [Cylindrospermum sp. FACHB-282]
MIHASRNLKVVFGLFVSFTEIYFAKTADAQIKVVDLEQKNTINSNICTSTENSQPEFIKVANLEENNITLSNVCTLANIEGEDPNSQQLEPQLGVEELERNQISPPNSQQLEPQLGVEELEPKDTSPIKKHSSVNPNYFIPPRIVPDRMIRPLTTTIPLNGIVINHLTKGQIVEGGSFSDNQNTNLDVNALVKFNSQIEESLTKTNIITINQTGDYLQLQTVRKSRGTIVTTKEPRTLLGTHLQISLTASCLNSQNPGDICTYTPGLKIDRYDPDTLLATRFSQTSNFGDLVTPESLAAMSEPGFQSGANGQEIGIDQFYPNIGSLSGNSYGVKTSISRKEEIENTPAVIYSQVRQVLRVNDREAVIGRTVRGSAFILNDENTLINTALQLGSKLLPDAVPSIAESPLRVQSKVNNNLFFAANNVRLPANSFTFYHAGIGRSRNLPPRATNLNQVPPANFNGIWLGASPIIKRTSSVIKTRYEQIGSRIDIGSGSGEGGRGSNVSYLSIVNGQAFSTATLENFYTQVYLNNFSQDANYVTTSKAQEETNYVPHISFTGNITGTQDVFRYYAGVLGVEEIKAYGGADFTKNSLNGWTFSGGFIAYTNPDVDYRTTVTGSVSKQIPFNTNANLVLSTGVNYAFGIKTSRNDFINSFKVGAQVNLGNLWFGINNTFGDVLPDSIDNTLTTNFGIIFNKNFTFTAYYSPINDNSTLSRYGSGVTFKLGRNQNSSILTLSWSNNEYNYGLDSSGNELGTNENVFSVFLRTNL